MSKDAGNPTHSVEAGVASSATLASGPTMWNRFLAWLLDLMRPWAVFLRVITDPFTALMLVAAVLLGWLGPKAIGDNGSAVVQVVVAVVTGVAGARIATVMADLGQEGKLYSSGRMAVRGLRLILTKTLALERRVAGFVMVAGKESSPEVRAAVAVRNLDEVLESIRTLQLEVAGSIENWVDVVPDSDVSQVLVAVGELREQLTQKEAAVRAAVEEQQRLKEAGNASAAMQEEANRKLAALERDKSVLQGNISVLKSIAAQKSQPVTYPTYWPYPTERKLLTANEIADFWNTQRHAATLQAIQDSAANVDSDAKK